MLQKLWYNNITFKKKQEGWITILGMVSVTHCSPVHWSIQTDCSTLCYHSLQRKISRWTGFLCTQSGLQAAWSCKMIAFCFSFTVTATSGAGGSVMILLILYTTALVLAIVCMITYIILIASVCRLHVGLLHTKHGVLPWSRQTLLWHGLCESLRWSCSLQLFCAWTHLKWKVWGYYYCQLVITRCPISQSLVT